ncbi:hypothetical protein MLD38_035301 [Melastoma candidum]|uniref:Uncharacterized protein n=1 Tax=Melastoma candidum TaxID=119954 RepID=A0ACB9MD99_9MYRT|nr:hypothetical protein MLD38_035301 [Melastoma candidum]
MPLSIDPGDNILLNEHIGYLTLSTADWLRDSSKKMGPETYWPSHSQSFISLVVGLGIFESDHVLTS